jgi:hypothetical protein
MEEEQERAGQRRFRRNRQNRQSMWFRLILPILLYTAPRISLRLLADWTHPLYQPQFPGFPFWVYQVPVPHLEAFFSNCPATPEPAGIGEAIATEARAVKAMIDLNIVVVIVVVLLLYE